MLDFVITMDSLSQTIDFMVDRMEVTCCSNCGVEIDISDLTLFDQIICPECDTQGSVPCKLGAYLMDDRIGSGAMGTVYKARDEFLDRIVAIKVMKKRLGSNDDAIQKFQQEAMAIAQLNHPNISQIYTFGKENEQPYIVMEYLPGDTLKDIMESHKAIDQRFILKTGIQIARALEAASEYRMVHGDVKPDNITYDAKGNAKLVDFGIATFEYALSGKSILGTPYYIAPERVANKKVDTRSDMYSLGATLYHALAGRPPFLSPDKSPVKCARMRLTSNPSPLKRYRKNIRPDVNKTILRMLEREPGRRHPNYTSLIREFEASLNALGKTQAEQLKSSARNKYMQPEKPKQHSSTARAISIVLILTAVIGALVIADVSRQKKEKAAIATFHQHLYKCCEETDRCASEIQDLKDSIEDDLAKILKIKPIGANALELTLVHALAPHNKIIETSLKKADRFSKDLDVFSARAKSIQTAIPNSRNSQEATDKYNDIKGIVQTLTLFNEEVPVILSRATSAERSASIVLESFESDKAIKAKQLEEETLAKKKENELEQRNAQAEQASIDKEKKLINKEQRLIDSARTMSDVYLKANEFDKAFELLIRIHPITENAKKQLATEKSKVTRLIYWQAWIANRLSSATPLKGAWMENGEYEDIIEAYDSGFRITGKFVHWTEVSPLLMFAFFNHLIKNERLAPDERTKLFFAAMTYASLHNAPRATDAYYRRAVHADPSFTSNLEAASMLATVMAEKKEPDPSSKASTNEN